jgi:hypothetical protein
MEDPTTLKELSDADSKTFMTQFISASKNAGKNYELFILCDGEPVYSISDLCKTMRGNRLITMFKAIEAVDMYDGGKGPFQASHCARTTIHCRAGAQPTHTHASRPMPQVLMEVMEDKEVKELDDKRTDIEQQISILTAQRDAIVQERDAVVQEAKKLTSLPAKQKQQPPVANALLAAVKVVTKPVALKAGAGGSASANKRAPSVPLEKTPVKKKKTEEVTPAKASDSFKFKGVVVKLQARAFVLHAPASPLFADRMPQPTRHLHACTPPTHIEATRCARRVQVGRARGSGGHEAAAEHFAYLHAQEEVHRILLRR